MMASTCNPHYQPNTHHQIFLSFENYKYISSLSFSFFLPLSSPLTTELGMAEKHDTITSSADIGQPNLTGITPKAIIKNVDMSEEMQQDSVDIASAALEKYNIEKDIAAQIKKEFDRKHGPTWHVVVGKNFGSYVTHGM
jgi:dynein light chain LC8-type